MLFHSLEAGKGRELVDRLGNLIRAIDDVNEERRDGDGVDDGEEVGRMIPGGRLEQRLEGFCSGSGLLKVGSRRGWRGHCLEGR